MKRLRTAAILAAVLLALGGLATWDEWQTKKDVAGEKDKFKLSDIQPNDVVEFDYFASGTDEDAAGDAGAEPQNPAKPGAPVAVSAVKKDGQWRLVKPIDGAADAATIEGLIKAVTEYSYSKVVSEKRDQWADFGLAEPKRRLTLRAGGDHPREHAILLGEKAPVGYNVYFRTGADDKVYMGSQHLMIATTKTLVDFRDKTVVKIDEPAIKTLAYRRHGQPDIELTKVDGTYALTKPEALDADSTEVRDFVDAVNSLRAMNFIDAPEDALRQAFVSPDVQVSWADEKGAATTLTFVEKEGKYYAAFDPARGVVVLGDDAKTRMRKELLNFRDRRVFAAGELEAASIEIDGEVYRNVAGSWYAAGDADKLDEHGKLKAGIPEAEKPVEKAHLRAFLVDLEFAKTDRFIPLDDSMAKELVEAPAHRVTLRYKAAPAADATAAVTAVPPQMEPVVIDLFQRESEGEHLLLRRTNGKFLYRVPKSVVASMKASANPPAGSPTPTSPGSDGDGGIMDEDAFPMDDPTSDGEDGLNLNQGQEDGPGSGGQDVSAKGNGDAPG